MSKPDWKNAPEWANWLAQDNNGNWYWYEYKPITDGLMTWRSTRGLYARCHHYVGWRESLEQRKE